MKGHWVTKHKFPAICVEGTFKICALDYAEHAKEERKKEQRDGIQELVSHSF